MHLPIWAAENFTWWGAPPPKKKLGGGVVKRGSKGHKLMKIVAPTCLWAGRGDVLERLTTIGGAPPPPPQCDSDSDSDRL